MSREVIIVEWYGCPWDDMAPEVENITKEWVSVSDNEYEALVHWADKKSNITVVAKSEISVTQAVKDYVEEAKKRLERDRKRQAENKKRAETKRKQREEEERAKFEELKKKYEK